MSDHTGIEWTDATWNPTTGCTKVSQGCTNCYAKRAWPRLQATKGTVYFEREFEQVGWHPQRLDQPIRWTRPRRIFVNSMSDLFHEDIPESFIDEVFAVMALTPQHTFQLLTKRPRRMQEYVAAGGRAAAVFDIVRNSELGYMAHGDRLPPQSWPLPNVWKGVSVEDQMTASQRIPVLLQTPAAVRWISAEPLLGPVILGEWLQWVRPTPWRSTTTPVHIKDTARSEGWVGLDWVVVGGESGPRARPMHPDWARHIRNECEAAAVPFLFKQWGEYAPNCRTFAAVDASTRKLTIVPLSTERIYPAAAMDRVGKRAAGRELDGRQWNEYPRSLL